MNAPVKLRPESPDGQSPPSGYDPTNMPPAIAEAVNAIMGIVKNVEKNGENTFFKYSFAKVEDLLFQVQPAMHETGLIIIQSEVKTNVISDALMTATYDFRLAHKTGAVWVPDQPIHHSGMASLRNTKGGYDDKALNKCHTAARKYFLMGLFQIPAGDLPDGDRDDTPTAEAMAVNLLRGCGSKEMLSDAWAKNRDPWRKLLEPDAYARVVAVMKDIAGRLQSEDEADRRKAERQTPPPPSGGAISRAAAPRQPAAGDSILDDEIPF